MLDSRMAILLKSWMFIFRDVRFHSNKQTSTRSEVADGENDMHSLRKIMYGIVISVLLISSGPLPAEAVSSGNGPAIWGDPFVRPITVKGQILCTNCTLDDIRQEQSGSNLYQLTNERGTMVFKLTWVNDRHLWRTIVWPRQLRVRTATEVFEQLTSEENLRAEVQLSGFLRNTRTFDIGQLSWVQKQPASDS